MLMYLNLHSGIKWNLLQPAQNHLGKCPLTIDWTTLTITDLLSLSLYFLPPYFVLRRRWQLHNYHFEFPSQGNIANNHNGFKVKGQECIFCKLEEDCGYVVYITRNLSCGWTCKQISSKTWTCSFEDCYSDLLISRWNHRLDVTYSRNCSKITGLNPSWVSQHVWWKKIYIHIAISICLSWYIME